MKGKQMWANEWRDKYSSPGDFEETGQQEAWMDGFNCARERAASFIESFGNPKTAGLAILIRAMGEGKVDANQVAQQNCGGVEGHTDGGKPRNPDGGSGSDVLNTQVCIAGTQALPTGSLCPGCGYPWAEHVFGEQGSSVCAPKHTPQECVHCGCLETSHFRGFCPKPGTKTFKAHQEGQPNE